VKLQPGSAPNPAGAAYSASPAPLAGFKGSLSLRDIEGRGQRKGEERGEEGQEGRGSSGDVD